MGNGSSVSKATTAAPTSASIDKQLKAASADELNAACAALSAEEKAKLAAALASSSAPRPFAADMAKQLEQRDAWSKNGPAFYAWQDQTVEAPLEPELEIVDSHHHIWDMRALKGFNLFGMMRQQYYMTDELVDDFVGAGHKVTHSVFVTTHAFFNAAADPPYMAPLGEVQFVQGVAAQFASGAYGPLRVAAGIVGSADLHTYGAELEPLLVACKAASPNYRGIRCNAAHDPKMPKGSFPGHPTPGMYAEAKFREGFALLAKHGLVFDAWVFSSQLAEVRELALSFPDTTIVLNHCGTPVWVGS